MPQGTFWCSSAKTREDREAAFRLIHDEYVAAGLSLPKPGGLYVTPYHLLPSTQVFLGRSGGQVVITASLVMDGELGIPMERVFPKEIERKRSTGVRFAEISCLAGKLGRGRFWKGFMQLAALIVQYSIRAKLDELLIAVHPRHAGLYQTAMAFVRFTGEKSYPAVQSHPAVGLAMSFERAKVTHGKRLAEMLAAPFPEEELQPHPMPEEEAAYFRALLAA